ncbi:MAG: hypothetical protein AAFY71_01795 [Bacteroidota bacterium]
MMSKTHLSGVLIILFLLTSFHGMAQRANPMLNVGSGNGYSGEAFNVFDLSSKDPINTTYWLDNWKMGEIHTKGGVKLTGYLLKYDVVNHNLDIKYNDSVKVLPGTLIKDFFLMDKGEKRYFVDINEYLGVNTYQLGFFELIREGETYSLIGKMETELLKSNYVATHDAGSRNDKFVKSQAYFLIYNKEVIRIPKKKKEALALFNKLDKGSVAYIKDNKIKLKSGKDLKLLVEHMDATK